MSQLRIVDAFFGSEELEKQGTTKITKTIFEGTQDREEKAMVFLDNMTKVRSNKNSIGGLQKFQDSIDENASMDTRSNTDKSTDLKKLEPLLEMASES